MTPTETKPAETPKIEGPVKFTVKKKVFDFETFSKKTAEAEGSHQHPKDMAEAMVHPLTNGDSAKILKFVQDGLLKEAKRVTKANIPTTGGSAKTVNTFVNTFRVMPLFAKDENGVAYTDKDRAKQTRAIYAWIQSNPVLLEQIKAAAVAALETEDGDDDDENAEDKETE